MDLCALLLFSVWICLKWGNIYSTVHSDETLLFLIKVLYILKHVTTVIATNHIGASYTIFGYTHIEECGSP